MRGRYRSGKLTNEFALIGRLRERFGDIGDDAAIVDPPPGPLLLAADAVVAGVHTPPDLPLEDLGWKAVVVNVSDIAAMGGRPLHLLVTVAAPPGIDLDGQNRATRLRLGSEVDMGTPGIPPPVEP